MCKNVVGYFRTSSTTNVKGDSRVRQSLSVKNYSKKNEKCQIQMNLDMSYSVEFDILYVSLVFFFLFC